MFDRSHSFFLFLQRLLVVLSAALLLLTAHRLLFFLTYKMGGEWQLQKHSVLQAFALGFRFDLSALSYVVALPVLSLWAWSFVGPRQQLSPHLLIGFRHTTSLLFCFAVFIIGVDFGYYSFFQDHINVLIFGFFNDDTISLLKTFWHNYPVIPILLILGLLYWWFYARVTRWLFEPLESPQPHRQKSIALLPTVTILLLSLSARGSLTMYPLGVFHTAISKSSFINALPMNGVHALGYALEVRSKQLSDPTPHLKAYGYQQKPLQAFSDYFSLPMDKLPSKPFSLLNKKTATNPWALKNRPHVVFILMESMGSDWLSNPQFPQRLKDNLAGQFKSRLEKDFISFNMLPSSGATIGSLGGLLINWPQRPLSPFLTESQWLNTSFPTAPAKVYKQNGYDTHYVYGGQLGWRGANRFISLQGFDQLHGDQEILQSLPNGVSDETHDWGVHDEAVFEYAFQLLSKASKPQFIFILTTSNHPPYSLPKTADTSSLSQLLPQDLHAKLLADKDLAQERLKAFRYSNDQLGRLVNRIEAANWGDRTILAATGDHGFYILPYKDGDFLSKWSVPFYIYDPSKKMPMGVQRTMGSHINIFPTLFDLSLSEVPYLSIAPSLLTPDYLNNHNYAVHASSLLLANEQAVQLQGEGNFSAWLKFPEEVQYQRLTIPQGAHMNFAKKYQALMALGDLYFAELLKEKAHK